MKLVSFSALLLLFLGAVEARKAFRKGKSLQQVSVSSKKASLSVHGISSCPKMVAQDGEFVTLGCSADSAYDDDGDTIPGTCACWLGPSEGESPTCAGDLGDADCTLKFCQSEACLKPGDSGANADYFYDRPSPDMTDAVQLADYEQSCAECCNVNIKGAHARTNHQFRMDKCGDACRGKDPGAGCHSAN